MSSVTGPGRLCNQIIRNKAMSLLAEKFDLEIEYQNYNLISGSLGIYLYKGNKKFSSSIEINDGNFQDYLENIETISSNIECTRSYFQREWMIELLYSKLNSEQENVIAKNPFRDRYKNNNDLFVHIRLRDGSRFVPPVSYFEKCIEKTNFDTLYIGSDDFSSPMIKEICQKYPKVQFVDKDPVETIQFGSTCKNIVLSQGSFSGIIGCLSFFSENIYYPANNLFQKGQLCAHWLIKRNTWTEITIE